MSAPAGSVARMLRFGSFELNLQSGELRKRGRRVRLQGQPIQVLALLLERSGDLVTRDEIRTRLWSADTFVDFDHSLHNAIARLRDVLGDSADAPRYIETLPRRGYRFIAPVEEVQAPQVAATPTSPPPAVPPLPSPMRRAPVMAILVCCAIALAAAAWQRANASGAATAIRSVAVLPLQNLSGDPAQEYFADGMTEELITELSRIQALKVISRTSVMDYKNTTKHLPQIARELGADGIIEGSIVREAGQVRVTVQLLDGRDDRHVWSEEYQRPVHGILDLQRDIAQAIAARVSTHISMEPARRSGSHSVNPDAYDAYLRGRYFLYNQSSTPQPLAIAKRYFEASIDKDPQLALAHTGLASVYLNLAFFRHLSPEAAFAAVKQSSAHALALDAGSSEAHAVLAVMRWRYEWNWEGAEREFASAIALDPSYDCVRADHACYLAWRGRRAEAFAEVTRGRELNPGDSYDAVESSVNYQLRDYAGLIAASRRGIVSNPDDWLERYFLGMGYAGQGQFADAVPELEKAVAMSAGDQDPSAALAHAYARLGRRPDAQAILDRLTQGSHDDYVSPYMLATIYAGLGDSAKAFQFLEAAVGERSPDVVWHFKADPRVDPLRTDLRFQALCARVGMK